MSDGGLSPHAPITEARQMGRVNKKLGPEMIEEGRGGGNE